MSVHDVFYVCEVPRTAATSRIQQAARPKYWEMGWKPLESRIFVCKREDINEAIICQESVLEIPAEMSRNRENGPMLTQINDNPTVILG